MSSANLIDIAPRDLVTAVRYAGASGDFNPLHYDPQAAEAAGFDRVLVHGGWLAAYVESRLSGLGNFRGYTARFERPVRIGESMQLSWTQSSGGEIDAVLSAGGEQRLSARLVPVASSIERPADFEALGAPYPWCVEVGALRDFVTATREGPADLNQLPLPFFGNAARWTPATTSIVRRLGFDYRRMLHGSTTVETFGAAVARYEELLVTEALANRSEKPHRSGGTMRMVDTVHEIADAQGVLRARVTNRFLERPART